ncbi:MAG: hypothetical protein IKE94_12535 [Aeriscardovia sp.]|nr:hypothetical protein [Aeriscardovia sp.]
MVNAKSKANLKKGRTLADRTKEEQRNIATMGGIASGKARQEKKTMRQLAEICLGAKLTKPEIEAKLKEAGLPATYGGQMLFNAVQMAGRNSNMLRVVLELIGEVKQAQTNVTVTNNVNPYAGLTEDELRKLANGE